ncbi:MAG: LAGLIDADG family homing endonuclease, partial [Candidatus Kerfeldbacteria bacterium]|nr:LAGLIDADG family homing endonuclease [Candidatus Kerfeldbacteria bacterium]
MQTTTEQWLKTIPQDKGYYFAGFADGEGSFNVSLRKRDDHHIGWQVVLTFNVSQKESYILSQFKKLLGCGRLQTRPD